MHHSIAVTVSAVMPTVTGKEATQLILRWFHFIAGITWVGLLYFFNLINVPFMKKVDASMKPKIVRGKDVSWKHLAASCAIPGLLPQRRIGGRWYSDGGLLNPLPVWAAAELGATQIVGVHALPEIPSSVLKPFVSGFRTMFGHNPSLPTGVEVVTVEPPSALGSVRDALAWKQENIERWIAQGRDAGKNISLPNCFWR